MLTAVDPLHARAKPAGLDQQLLGASAQFAKLLQGTMHVFHAYMPLVSVDPAPVTGAPPLILPPEIGALHATRVEHAVNRLADKAHISRARRHIRMGEVSAELRAVTRRTRAALVVMGAVSRSALARFFIGNTAERVLDKLTCDVLIVKPKGFAAKAARESPTARPGRVRESAARNRSTSPAAESIPRAARAPLPPFF